MTADTEPTVRQLIDEDLPGPDLGARLDAIRECAAGGGVAVTVDLHGRLVALTIDHTAMRLPAHELAARIKALTDRAAATALASGLALLTGALGESVAAELPSLR